MTYKTIFEIPEDFIKDRVLLHFGAVDEVANVYVNDIHVGKHEGGYLHFSFDITHAIKTQGKNELRVEVEDTLSRVYPYGKQSKKRGGMWYTPVSGIWQTVWLEEVADSYIEKIIMTSDLKGVDIEVVFNSASVDKGGNKNNNCGKNDNGLVKNNVKGFNVVI